MVLLVHNSETMVNNWVHLMNILVNEKSYLDLMANNVDSLVSTPVTLDCTMDLMANMELLVNNLYYNLPLDTLAKLANTMDSMVSMDLLGNSSMMMDYKLD